MPHFGDCTHDGQPRWHSQASIAALVAATVLLVMLAGLLYVHVPISVLLSTPALEQAQIFLFVLGLTLHLTLLAVSLRRERERHRQASVYRDPATGMLNHAGLAKEFRRWHQVQRPFALAALNINLFESILIVFGLEIISLLLVGCSTFGAMFLIAFWLA